MTQPTRYFVLAKNRDMEDSAILSDPPKQIDDEMFMFDKGTSLAKWFPSDAQFPMDPDFPKARRLCDFQHNTLGLLVVSREARATLEESGCDNVEYLPISIFNHRGKLASADYAIANVLELVDGMDRERSTYENNPLIPSKIISCSKLVLREDAIPRQLRIFRLTNAPGIHIITESLKQEMEKRGLTGMLFVPIEEYDTDIF